MASTNLLIQGKYVIGKHSVVGDPRRKWEDRVYTGEIIRADGESLLVGMVADGVGSADFGSRGAQLAIDITVRSLERSQGVDIPKILETAIEAANRAVYNENTQHEGDGLTTLVVAIIYKDRCYLGNVGDSRVYWVQAGGKGKLLQLTRDHSYYNVYGGDPNGDDAGIVVNAIGKKADVQVDLGFYIKGDDVEQAYKLGINGLPIKAGDTILLCSDGLIKTNIQHERYIEDTEIVNALQTEYMPDRAAIKMVSTVEGRRPDDNISVVTLQALSKQIVQEMNARNHRIEQAKLFKKVGIGMGSALVLFLAVFLFYKISQIQNGTTVTQVVTAPPFPTVPAGFLFVAQLPEGASAQVTSPNGSITPLTLGQIPVAPGTQIDVLSGVVSIGLPDGSALYLAEGTSLKFDRIMDPNSANKETVLSLNKGAVMVKVISGSIVVQAFDGIIARVSGSIMGVQLGANHYVDCYEGHCSISGNITTPIDSMDGDRRYLAVSANQLLSSNILDRCQAWGSLLGPIFDQLGIQECLIPPTPTLIPTPTTNPNVIQATPKR